jgi:hypothetical protein
MIAREARKKDHGDVEGDFEVLVRACKGESIEVSSPNVSVLLRRCD